MVNIFIKGEKAWFFYARVEDKDAPNIAKKLSSKRKRCTTIVYDSGKHRFFNRKGREITYRTRKKR